jgi:outer membrane lipoprotein-sorting protein
MRPNDDQQFDDLQRLLQDAYPTPMPTEQFADRLRDQLLAAAPAPRTVPNRITQRIGAVSMRRRIGIILGGVGAAAAIALLVILAGVTANPVSAMERMAGKIREAKSLKVAMSMECRFSQEPGKPPTTATMSEMLYWLAPESYRMEAMGGAHTSGVDGTQIIPAGQPGLRINPTTKTFQRVPPRVAAESPALMFDKLGTLSGQADRDLGEKDIHGVKARGFEIDGKKITADAYSGPVQIWLDPQSDLPIFVRWEARSPAGPVLVIKIEDFRWNIDLDPKLFVAEPPPGYVEEKKNPAEFPAPEKVLQGITFALKTYAELCGGHYPQIARSFAEPVRDEMFHAAGFSYPGTLEQRMHDKQYRKVLNASQGFAVFNRVFLYNPDVAYYGKTVGPNDKDKVLLRWKLDDGRYQVLFGDLSGETVTADRLGVLEGK